MIGFVQLLIDLINRYTIWIYAVGVVVILFYLRMYLLASRGKRDPVPAEYPSNHNALRDTVPILRHG